jgi:hypothetical protein
MELFKGIRFVSYALCGAFTLSSFSPTVSLAKDPNKKRRNAEAREHRKEEWKESHPERTRQAQERKDMYKQINQEQKSGKISKDQAKELRQEVHQDGQEVRRDAASNHNGGHLNKDQVKDTRQDLNKTEQDIQSAGQPSTSSP